MLKSITDTFFCIFQPPLPLNSNGWRPVLSSSEKTTLPPSGRSSLHPVITKFQAHMQHAARNKRIQNLPASSNKVETFVPPPPSILGSFSVFGHATVKTRDFNKKKTKSEPKEHLVPPPLQAEESSQRFRYERPSDGEQFFAQSHNKKPFFPSQQIGEFPESNSYSTIAEPERFSSFYKGGSVSHTSTKFGEGDVKFFPQTVGIQVSGSQFSQPGQVQDVPAYSTGTQFGHILPGSTPLTSFDDQVYVTTWQPEQEPPKVSDQQYFSKLPIRDTDQKYYVKRPFSEQMDPQQQFFAKKPNQKPVTEVYATDEQQFYSKRPSDDTEEKYVKRRPTEVRQSFRPKSPTSFSEELYFNKNPLLLPGADIKSASKRPTGDNLFSYKTPISEMEQTFISGRPISNMDEIYLSKGKPSNLDEQYLLKRPTTVETEQQHIPKRNAHKRRPVQEEVSFVPTQLPTTQTYVRRPDYSEQTTLPPTYINEVHIRKPLLPTPLTEEEITNQDFYMFPEEEELKQTKPLEERPNPTRRPVNRRPTTQAEANRFRRPSHNEEKQRPSQSRRPTNYNRYTVHDEQIKHRRRRPTIVDEELTTIPITEQADQEDEPSTPFPVDSQAFNSRKRIPSTENTRTRDRPRKRPQLQQTTEKPTTESVPYYQWEGDEYTYDPESQSTSFVFEDVHTLNEVTDDDFKSTKTGVSLPSTTSSTTTTAATTTTSTTSTSTTTPPPSPTTTTESTLKLKPRLRYGTNYTRPRFSVKDYRERLRQSQETRTSNTTSSSGPVTNTNRGRTRASSNYNSNNNSSVNTRQEESRVNPQRFGNIQRHRISTTSSSITTSTSTSTEIPTTTERLNQFKPSNSRYRPGAGRYSNRYRPSTEATDIEPSASSTSTRAIVMPKPLFLSTRKPYPLRSRYGSTSTTSTTTEEPINDAVTTSEDILKSTENEVVPEISNKSDVLTTITTTTTTTTTTPSETDATKVTEVSEFETETLSPSQIVADLTSSASSGGYFKTAAPSNKRNNLRITMATDDPILPIEAFFPVRSSRAVSS